MRPFIVLKRKVVNEDVEVNCGGVVIVGVGKRFQAASEGREAVECQDFDDESKVWWRWGGGSGRRGEQVVEREGRGGGD